MQSTQAVRIRINDLPPIECLTDEEMEAIFGAGLFGSKPKRKYGQRRPFQLESLEARELMAADLSARLSNNTLHVVGTDGTDLIRVVRTNEQVSIEGTAIQTDAGSKDYISASLVKGIQIESRGGADQIWLGERLASLQIPVDMHAGVGGDRVHLAGDVDGMAMPSSLETFSQFRDAEGFEVRTSRDESGNYVQTTLADDRRILEETWDDKGNSTRMAWSENGNRLRQTFRNEKLIMEEAWDTGGGLRRTEWMPDGSVVRQTFQDQKLRLKEEHLGNREIRTAWSESGTILRQTFNEGNLAQEEIWDGTGELQRTTWLANEAKTREVFQNDIRRLKEEWQGDQFVRTAWTVSGSYTRETFDKWRRISEERYDATGNSIVKVFSAETAALLKEDVRSVTGTRRITTWNADAKLEETFQNGVLVRREDRRATSIVQTAWDANGGSVRETYSTTNPNVSVRETWDGRGGSTRSTYSADGKLTKEEKWNASAGSQTTTWNADSTRRQTYQDGKLVLSEEWRGTQFVRTGSNGTGGSVRETQVNGKLTLREAWDGQGNSYRNSYGTDGQMVKEEKWNSTGGCVATTWNSDSTLRMTYQDGKSILQEEWRGTRFTRTAWDGKGGSVRDTFESGTITLREAWDGKGGVLRNTYSAGKQIREEVWNNTNGKRTTNWYADRSVWRQYYANGAEVYRQTWSASGVYSLSRWGIGQMTISAANESSVYAVLSGLASLRGGFKSSWESISLSRNVVVSTPGTVAQVTSSRVRGLFDPQTFGTSFEALTQGISVDGTVEQLNKLRDANRQLNDAIKSQNFEKLPQLLTELTQLQQTVPAAARETLGMIYEEVARIQGLTSAEVARMTAAQTAERDRLVAEQKQLSTFQATLVQIVKEYNEAWTETRKQLDPTSKLRIFTPTPTTSQAPTTQGPAPAGRSPASRGPIGATPASSPTYINPEMTPPKTRIFVQYDRVLHVSNQLKSAMVTLLGTVGPEVSSQLRSAVDLLTAGVATYFDESTTSEAARKSELERVHNEANRVIDSARSIADEQIQQKVTERDRSRDPLLTQRTAAEQQATGAIAAATRKRDEIVTSNQKRIDDAKAQADRDTAAAAVTRGEMMPSDGFALNKYAKEQLKGASDAIDENVVDPIKDAGGRGSDWWKEKVNEAETWYSDRIKVIQSTLQSAIALPQMVINSAKAEYQRAESVATGIRDMAVATINPLLNTIEAAYQKAVTPILQERDRVVAHANAIRSKQANDIQSIYGKVIAEARDEIFSVGERQLGDVLTYVTSKTQDLGGKLAAVSVQNAAGPIAALKAEAFTQVSKIVTGGLKTLETVGAEISSASASAATWADDRWEAMSDYSNERWQAFESYAGERLEAALDYADDRWMAFETLFRNDSSDRQVSRIAVTPASSNAFGIDINLGQSERNKYVRGMRVVVEHNGETIKDEYVPVSRDFGSTFHTEFTPHGDGEYTIIVELKDGNNKWYESELGHLKLQGSSWIAQQDLRWYAGNEKFESQWFKSSLGPLVVPTTESVVIYNQSHVYNEGEEILADSSSSSSRAASFGRAVVTARTEAEAEASRGFALPYVLASANLYETPNGRFVLGMDMVQVTEETEIELVVQRVDDDGNSIAPEIKSKAEADFRQKSASLSELAGDYAAFQQFAIDKYNFDGETYDELITFFHGQYSRMYQYLSEIGELPANSRFLDKNEWWFGAAPAGFEGYSTGQMLWADVYGGTGSLREAAEAQHALAALRAKGPDLSAVPQDQQIKVSGAAIAKGVDLTEFVEKVKNEGHNYQVAISVKGGSAAAQMTPIDEVSLSEQIRIGFRQAVEGGLKSIGQGLGSFIRSWPVFRASNWDKIAETTHNALGVAGMAPVVGAFADGADMVLYAIEGDWTQVAISGAAMIPGLGDAVKGAVLGATKTGVLRVARESIEKVGDAALEQAFKRTRSVAESVDKVALQLRSLADDLGIFRAAATHYQVIAESFNVVIAVRPTTKVARDLLSKGLHLPKPGELKQKTINELDRLLGAKGGIGEVAMFQPVKPASMTAELQARFAQREQEWVDYQKQYQKMTSDITYKYRIDQDTGVISIRQGWPDAGKRFTGDNDTFAILDEKGIPLQDKDPRYEQVKKALRLGDTRAMHDEHIAWSPTELRDIDAKQMIIDSHTSVSAGGTGEKKLGVFTPGQKPALRYADDL